MGKDEEEWKSSHDRFVEAMERFMSKAEKEQEKQFGFVVEMTRDELRTHFLKRAEFHADEAFTLSEEKPEIPPHLQSHPALADGSLRTDGGRAYAEMMAALEKAHTIRIANAHAKAQSFAFAAKYMPEGKKIFVFTMAEAHALELIPGLQEEPFTGGLR